METRNETGNEIGNERKPLLALTASFLMPGLGQIYNGDYSKGLSFFLTLAFSVPAAAWLGLHGPEPLLWIMIFLGVGLAFAVYILSIVDAYQSAGRIGKAFQPKPLNRPSAYIAILFFGYFFVLIQLSQLTRENLVEAYQVPSHSMVPSLLPGDHIFVDKSINRPGAKDGVHRGDLAIFVNPNNRTQIYVKRVIGLPGDLVEIKDTVVTVNGNSIQGPAVSDLGSPALNRLLETHVAYQENGDTGRHTVIWEKSARRNPFSLTVPNGQVFVLGDNRDSSADSRVVGPIPLVDVIAKVKQVWLSYSNDSGVRWNRFGRVVD